MAKRFIGAFFLAAFLAGLAHPASARLLDRILERGEEAAGEIPGAVVARDIAYGANEKQRIDVYAPPNVHAAPLIVMIHGGAWEGGDKTNSNVVENKATHWLARGLIFISVNYRLLPEANPVQQAEDAAAAIAFIEKKAADWGGNPAKIIVMGHSSGAHLAALIAGDPAFAAKAGAKPWAGTVVIDTEALSVSALMQGPHYGLFDKAFGSDPAFWTASSPYDQLQRGTSPMLMVCSQRRKESCPQAHEFAARAQSLGIQASVIEEDLTHENINENLGLPGAYTDAVDAFIRPLLGLSK